jgi:hypothetical protein
MFVPHMLLDWPQLARNRLIVYRHLHIRSHSMLKRATFATILSTSQCLAYHTIWWKVEGGDGSGQASKKEAPMHVASRLGVSPQEDQE